MNLYYWSSERFSNYLSGSIIVMASTVKQARKKALSEYKRIYETESLRQFEEDIDREPIVIDCGVIFDYGSG